MKLFADIENLYGIQKIYFLGIGGAGMSPLAEYLHFQGFSISGYDDVFSDSTERLKNKGIFLENKNIHDKLLSSDLIVYSSAILKDHPKRQVAKKYNIPEMRRADFLGELMHKTQSLTVSGTHGKTTTTFMLGYIWSEAKKNPIVLGGGYAKNNTEWNINTKEKREVLIIEADEYDRSFLAMHPTWALINNLEEEHMDCYKNLNELRDIFLEFMHRVPLFGLIVLNRDDSNLQYIIPLIKRKYVTFGIDSDATYKAVNIYLGNEHTFFEVLYDNSIIAQVEVPILGLHNVYNALGAFSISHSVGIKVEFIVRGLRNFNGVQRRLDLIGESHGIQIYDDYAHHPSEIIATIKALKPLGRLIVIFQPHLYSRTKMFYKEFAKSLQIADCVFVTPIYKAREKEIDGISELIILENLKELKEKEGGPEIIEPFLWTQKNMDTLQSKLTPGDVVVTMGAGNIWKVGKYLLKNIKKGK